MEPKRRRELLRSTVAGCAGVDSRGIDGAATGMSTDVLSHQHHVLNGRIRPLDTPVGSRAPKQEPLSGIRRRKC